MSAGERLLSTTDEAGDPAPDAPPSHRAELRAAWAAELRAQLRITLPLALTLLTRFVQGFVDVAVVGRLLGSQALAGASLALTIAFTATGVITAGCGDAVAALCAQSLGAGQRELCGLWLQAGMACSTAALAAAAPLFLWAGAIVRAAGADEATSAFAAAYARLALLRALVHVNYYCYKVFLAAQRRLAPDVAGCVAGLVVGCALDVALVGGTCALAGAGVGSGGASAGCWPGLGFVGAPIAAAVARAVTAAAVLALAQLPACGGGGCGEVARDGWAGAGDKDHADSDVAAASRSSSGGSVSGGGGSAWTGWALHAGEAGALRRDRLAAFAAVALPASCRALVDQGQIAGLALMAASMGPAAAGAHNAAIELYACVGGAFCWAGCDAVLVRVGTAMGAGDARAARRAVAVGVATAVAFALTLPPALLLPARGALGRLFSDDPAVAAVTSATAPAMVALILATGVVFALLGGAIGAGRAAAGGTAWLAGVAAVVPVAYGWGVAAGGGVPALWGAITAGYALSAAVLAVLLLRLDWPAAARAAAAGAAAAAASAAGDGGACVAPPGGAPLASPLPADDDARAARRRGQQQQGEDPLEHTRVGSGSAAATGHPGDVGPDPDPWPR